MYIETKIKNIQRTATVPQRAIQGVPTRKLQDRCKKGKNATKSNKLFFNLTAKPILSHTIIGNMTEKEMRHFSCLMVDVTKKLTGNIDSWSFNENDSLQDLVLRCGNRLKDRANVDHIDVYRVDDNEVCLNLKQFIGSRSKIYCVCLKPIFNIKNKNRTLYSILLSFVKSLPFTSIFDTFEHRIDWLLTCQFEELAHCKEVCRADYLERLKGSVGFFTKYEPIYDKVKCSGWKSNLESYKPRKKIYKDIKELLLTTDTVDFSTPYRISVREGYECMMEHSHTFLIVDDDDSEFTHSYIQMLNENSNEYDIISAYAHTVVKQGKIEPFEENINHKLSKVEDFICALNDLIQKI